MGLSVSDAVRLFLRRVVVDHAFPLELKVSNAETLAAMEESRAMMSKRRARFASADELFADLEKKKQRQVNVRCYHVPRATQKHSSGSLLELVRTRKSSPSSQCSR